jgi:transcriptional regulator with XRE-family HTH domain
VAASLGRGVRNRRHAVGLTQKAIAQRAGVAASTVSMIETGHGASVSLLVWTRVARATGVALRAYLEQTSVADEPRDIVHLRTQELVIRTATAGGWTAHPEAAIDSAGERSRSVDVLLTRRIEVAVMEICDWFDDVGAASRAWDRRLAGAETWAIGRLPAGRSEVPRVSGCWIVRATARNRQLVRDHAAFFRARFPGSASAWLAALSAPDVPMPLVSALLWVSVNGKRLFPARLGTGQTARRCGR